MTMNAHQDTNIKRRCVTAANLCKVSQLDGEVVLVIDAGGLMLLGNAYGTVEELLHKITNFLRAGFYVFLVCRLDGGETLVLGYRPGGGIIALKRPDKGWVFREPEDGITAMIDNEPFRRLHDLLVKGVDVV